MAFIRPSPLSHSHFHHTNRQTSGLTQYGVIVRGNNDPYGIVIGGLPHLLSVNPDYRFTNLNMISRKDCIWFMYVFAYWCNSSAHPTFQFYK